MKVLKGSLTVMKGVNELYVLEGETIVGYVDSTKEHVDKTRLWHLRLGHVSEIGLTELSKQISYVETSIRICGDLPIKKGSRYFISIIDDYSRKLWVTTLTTKDQAFQSFKDWKAMVENQIGKKVKKFRTDNGLEFCNEKFNQFCKKEEIAVTGTPQHNSLAERINMTILERVRCMLSNARLPRNFWAEATEELTKQWYLRFDQFMEKIVYNKSSYDSCVYFRDAGSKAQVSSSCTWMTCY